MREILFRGKSIGTAEWVYGSFIPDLLEVYQGDIKLDGFIKPFGRTKEERQMVEVERKTVGQYIGLTDKNGTRIFEGDIIAGKTGVFGIRWSKTICCFVAGEGFSIRPYMNQGTMQDYEVIGNIYDNPELLEANNGE